MSANLDLVQLKVQRYLTDLGPVSLDSDGDLSLQVGSARLFVRVLEHPNGESTLVHLFAFLVDGATLGPELYEYVATFDDTIFGTLLVVKLEDGTGRVVLRETLLGDFLDADELHAAVLGLAYAGDQLDDEIAEAFGGDVFHPDGNS